MPRKSKAPTASQPFEAPQTGLATIRQACKFLSFSRGKVDLMRKNGELSAKKIGRSVRIPWPELHAVAAR